MTRSAFQDVKQECLSPETDSSIGLNEIFLTPEPKPSCTLEPSKVVIDATFSKAQKNIKRRHSSDSVNRETVLCNEPVTMTESFEVRKENAALKLQINAAEQTVATLELEIKQKEEVIIKTQAQLINMEMDTKKFKDNDMVDNNSIKIHEQQLKELEQREAKLEAELNEAKEKISQYE